MYIGGSVLLYVRQIASDLRTILPQRLATRTREAAKVKLLRTYFGFGLWTASGTLIRTSLLSPGSNIFILYKASYDLSLRSGLTDGVFLLLPDILPLLVASHMYEDFT